MTDIRIIVPLAKPPSVTIDTISNINLGVGQTHNMAQYINDPFGQVITTNVTGLAGFASYDSGTKLLTGVSLGTETGLQLVVTF